MRIKKPSPTRVRRHGGAVTDEGAANLIRPLSQPSAASSPERGAFGAHSVGAEQSPAPTRCRANKEDLLAKRCSLTDPDCTFYL